jgi:hypothetical protein
MMIRALPVCALLLALPLLARAGEPSAAKETIIRLKVPAAAAPRPALRYPLLPEMSELEPGNAILGYTKCFMEQGNFFSSQEEKKREKWLEMPLKDLPLDELRAAGIRKESSLFRRADHAARLEHADWQTLLPLRGEGYSLLIPEVAQSRSLARVLALRLRVDVADRDFDDAFVTTRTLLAMARHLGEHPTLIGELVGISFVNLTVTPLEEMLQQPGCPNLYWSLTDLPEPLIGIRLGLQAERMVFETIGGLKSRQPMTEAQLKHAVDQIDAMLRPTSAENRKVSGPVRDPRGWITAQAGDEAKVRAARERLVASGLPEDRVRRFPALQVVLLDDKLTADLQFDELKKALMLPYWQAEKTIQAAQPSKGARENLFAEFVPAVLKVRHAQVRMQQRIALLRCVEALRLYAADNDGRLPARLEDLNVPMPVDPVTGKVFRYSVDGATATIRGTPPMGMEKMAPYNVRYEVTIAN